MHFEKLIDSLTNLLSWTSSSFIVFGGMIPYIPQYIEIKKSQNCQGFSLYVCLVLIISNSLRILFWFGHWFETPLLVQSIVMILTMLLLLDTCVKTQRKVLIVNDTAHVFTDFELKYFWKWTDTLSYVEFIFTFNFIVGFILYNFRESEIFVESLGFISLFTESLLGIPQFYQNLNAKSTYGMSRKMVYMWFLGDSFKTVYYYLKEVPIQFLMCGAFQIMVDILILTQCFVYKTACPLI